MSKGNIHPSSHQVDASPSSIKKNGVTMFGDRSKKKKNSRKSMSTGQMSPCSSHKDIGYVPISLNMSLRK